MSVKQLSPVAIAIAIGSCTFTAQANNETGRNLAPNQPANNYWQAPNRSGFNAPPAYNNNYQRPPQQMYRQPPPNYPAPNMNRTAPPPPTGPYSGAPAPQQNPSRGAPAPQQIPSRGAPAPRGQYNGPYNGPYNEPSAFNTPGYNPYNRNRGNRMPWGNNNNRFGNNKFWGRSGPSKWMNPGKDNWENSWDDMINAPSRVGEMPGGWTAPEVTMPNPIDMGDQMQDNVQDLPEQMKDGDIGNNVSN